MHTLAIIFRKAALIGSTVLLVGISPLLITIGSLTSADTPETCSPTTDYGTGVHYPNGADAATFTYQCPDQPYAGLYYNGYYTYDPVSQTRTAVFPMNYSYNCNTGVWTRDQWDYNPGTGTFIQSRVRTSDPGLPTGCPPPPAPVTPAGITNSSSITGTGNGSTNGVDNSITLNGTTTNTNDLNMTNFIIANALTGNASLNDNTIGGDATTGNASDLLTILNLLQSSSNVLGNGTATFTADINGDVNGDILLDPSAIVGSGANSTNTTDNNLTINTNDTNNTNAQINNNINATATSGDATVDGNTQAGNATSGSASAIVNLLNLINSTVAAGHSFIGTININGNLNGDILLPQSFIDEVLAATGANSNNNATNTVNGNSTTTNNTTEGINNNISSTATTGDANMSGNTTAGSALTGNATTNVTLLNLTGSSVVGSNDLLVFVNVLGHWVGMIMNAPAGSTSAELGGGITNTGNGSTNGTNNSVNVNSNQTNNTNLGINNNVNVAATSGNANVRDNTQAGNATTGNASTGVNVLNMVGSNLSLSNWFGVLFINVFGLWNGSFGINTAAGNQAPNPNASNQVQTATQEAQAQVFKQFATFAAHGSGGSNSDNGTTSAAVLGSSTTPVAQKIASSVAPSLSNNHHSSYLMPIVGFGLAGLILLAGERGRFFGDKK